MVNKYPGYEIERFEDEGGNWCESICFTPESSLDNSEAEYDQQKEDDRQVKNKDEQEEEIANEGRRLR